MPWYKIKASHGNGHQGNTTHYKFCDHELNKEEKEELFSEVFREYTWPIGTVTISKGLPAKEKQRKIESYNLQIENANKMLSILESTKEIRERLNKSEIGTQVFHYYVNHICINFTAKDIQKNICEDGWAKPSTECITAYLDNLLQYGDITKDGKIYKYFPKNWNHKIYRKNMAKKEKEKLNGK